MKPKVNIGVTGLNAIRCLREATAFDVRIIGLAYESLEPGIYMHDLVDHTYQIPYPTAGTELLHSRLEYIQSIEKLDLIIPNFDAELYPFIKLEPKLKKLGIRLFTPTLKQFEEREKVNLNEFGEKYHLHVPKSKAIYELNAINNLGNDFTFPVIVKGKFYDAVRAYNYDQVRSAFSKISAQWGLPIIIQEFIQGTEFNVTGLGDGKGNTISLVPMRKQYITEKGKAWGGISISDEKMQEMTRKFIKQTKWRGGFELELMKDKKGKIYLFEINPRMPAWIYLSAGVGQNIPEALVRLAMGEKVEPFTDYKVGKMFIRFAWDMIVDRNEFEQISINGEL